MTVKRLSLLGLLLWGVAVHAPASAEPADLERAKALFREGKARYQAGEYAEAIDAFGAAARIQPSPILDFNIGRCYHKRKEPAQAIAAYERYLEAKPAAENRQQVQGWIAELKDQLPAPAEDPYAEADRDSKQPASQPASAPAALAPSPTPVAPRARTVAPGPDELPHEAAMPPSWQGPAASGAAAAPVRQLPQQPSPRQEGPLYKQWWFWAACAGGALIAGFIIATAVSSPDSPPPPSTSRSALQFAF